jgi:hypothetical protein
VREPRGIHAAPRHQRTAGFQVQHLQRDVRHGRPYVERQVAVHEDDDAVAREAQQRVAPAGDERDDVVYDDAARGTERGFVEDDRRAALRRTFHRAVAHMADGLYIAGREVDFAHRGAGGFRARVEARAFQLDDGVQRLARRFVRAVQHVARVVQCEAGFRVVGLPARFVQRQPWRPGRHQRGRQQGQDERRPSAHRSSVVFLLLSGASSIAAGAAATKKCPGEPGHKLCFLQTVNQLRISSARFRLSAASDPTAPDSRYRLT